LFAPATELLDGLDAPSSMALFSSGPVRLAGSHQSTDSWQALLGEGL